MNCHMVDLPGGGLTTLTLWLYRKFMVVQEVQEVYG